MINWSQKNFVNQYFTNANLNNIFEWLLKTTYEWLLIIVDKIEAVHFNSV